MDNEMLLFEVYTIAEVMEHYDLTRQTIQQACREKRIAARQSGITWLMRRSDVERYWAHKKREANGG